MFRSGLVMAALDSRVLTPSLMGLQQGQTADVTHTLTNSLSAEMRCQFPQSFIASGLLNPKCVPTGTQSTLSSAVVGTLAESLVPTTTTFHNILLFCLDFSLSL